MNTPRTDAACGWPWGHHGRIETADLRWSPDGPFVHSSVARAIERENAALRQALEDMPTCRCGLSADEQCDLSVQNAALRAELEAQAVVNGKGGEREAKLLAEVAGLRGALEESQEYGRNHANAVIKLLSVISRIRRAVDEQPNKSQAMRLEDVGDLCDEALGKKAQP